MSTTRRPSLLLASAVALLLLSSTAVAVTRGAEPDRIAFLARADNPVDALAASSVAAQLGGVVLLSDPAALSAEARDALAEFAPTLVVLAGGTAALSERVAQDVASLGYEVRRIAGSSRLGTAAAIAEFLGERPAAFLPVAGTAQDALHAAQADHASTADSATTADRATTADSATSATTADSATTAGSATTAATAADAQALGGVPAAFHGPVFAAAGQGTRALVGGIFNTNIVLSADVAVPADGMLLVHGSAVISGGGHGSFSCSVNIGQSILASGLGVTDPVLMTETGSCAATGAVPIQAGTHTLQLVLRVEEGGHSATLRTIVAQFSPNGAVVPSQ